MGTLGQPVSLPGLVRLSVAEATRVGNELCDLCPEGARPRNRPVDRGVGMFDDGEMPMSKPRERARGKLDAVRPRRKRRVTS